MGATFEFLATMDYHSPAVSRRGTEKSSRHYCSLTFEHLKNEYPTNSAKFCKASAFQKYCFTAAQLEIVDLSTGNSTRTQRFKTNFGIF